MSKNNCSFLLAIVMITSYVVTSIALPFSVHAESFQKLPNGTKLTVEELGFEITFPTSWEGKYEITGEEDYIDILFKYENELYTYHNHGVPPLFTIYVGPNDGDEEGLRGVRELAAKGDKAYYVRYEALHLYNDAMSPGPAKDELLKLLQQTEEVLSTFKLLDTEEQKLKDKKEQAAVAEEAKSKQSNGIEYINKKLGFALTLPDFWENHYIIEENDNGGIIVKFKYNGKVFDDVYLFNINAENREYSAEDQQMLGDNYVISIGNGKTFLVTENPAMYTPPDQYDKHFSAVPPEGRKVIEKMSNQQKIIDFTVLEGSSAGEAVENGDFSQWNRILSERLSKTIVNKQQLLHAFRNYSDRQQAVYTFKDMWDVDAGMAPGTVLISPDSIAKDFRYGHAAIVAPDGWHVIEAAGPGKGVRKTHINDFIKIHPYWAAYIVDGATEEQSLSAALYAEEQLGKPYITDGPLGAFGDVFWRGGFLTGKYREDAFYCSSIVWRAWKYQGFDIDFNDDKPTPVDEKGSIVDKLTFFNIFIPEEKAVTVFPAEIVNDPLMVTVAVSEELKGQDMEPKTAEFTNKLTKFILRKGTAKPFKMDIWQSKGHIFKLKVTKNEALNPIAISLYNSSTNKEVYNDVLEPGETLKDIYVEATEGYHTLEITSDISNTGDVEGTIMSVFPEGELIDSW